MQILIHLVYHASKKAVRSFEVCSNAGVTHGTRLFANTSMFYRPARDHKTKKNIHSMKCRVHNSGTWFGQCTCPEVLWNDYSVSYCDIQNTTVACHLPPDWKRTQGLKSSSLSPTPFTIYSPFPHGPHRRAMVSYLMLLNCLTPNILAEIYPN
jgi:hypothetical protein